MTGPDAEPTSGPDEGEGPGGPPGWAPPGGAVHLPGRGTTWARDSGPAAHDRPTVLLLHGWGVTADLNFFTTYEALAADHRVVALDHRGHGRGIRPTGGIVHLADCADDAVALLDHLGVDRVVAVGYSMGGPVAQDLWRRHRDRVAGLVLCATARHFQAGRLSGLFYGTQAGLAHLAHRADGPARLLLAQRVQRRVADGSQAEWMRRELLLTDPAGALSALASIGRFRSSDWIGEVDVPTSVVVHTRDRTVPVAGQRGLAAAVPRAEVFEVPLPHDAIVTHPESYVPTLVAAVRAATPPT